MTNCTTGDVLFQILKLAVAYYHQVTWPLTLIKYKAVLQYSLTEDKDFALCCENNRQALVRWNRSSSKEEQKVTVNLFSGTLSTLWMNPEVIFTAVRLPLAQKSFLMGTTHCLSLKMLIPCKTPGLVIMVNNFQKCPLNPLHTTNTDQITALPWISLHHFTEATDCMWQATYVKQKRNARSRSDHNFDLSSTNISVTTKWNKWCSQRQCIQQFVVKILDCLL